MLQDDILRLGDPVDAILWLVGVRSLTGTANPNSLSGFRATLIEDGMAVRLTTSTARGTSFSCIATLPFQMSEHDMSLDALFSQMARHRKLRDTPSQGSA